MVTLVKDHGLTTLKETDIGKQVRACHMDWFDLPIQDAFMPDDYARLKAKTEVSDEKYLDLAIEMLG